ncbi:hypothetical protein Leryth_001705 [Lithospermum erythrorhizon]|nr:hypothetical protein Leryth_001705 [Lithospermum erythrorhizon]
METFKHSSAFLFLLAFAITFAFPSLIHAQNMPQDYVDAHNAARSQVNVPPVTWDTNLAAYAQNYANQRAAGDCGLVHSGGPYGENIAPENPELTFG